MRRSSFELGDRLLTSVAGDAVRCFMSGHLDMAMLTFCSGDQARFVGMSDLLADDNISDMIINDYLSKGGKVFLTAPWSGIAMMVADWAQFCDRLVFSSLVRMLPDNESPEECSEFTSYAIMLYDCCRDSVELHVMPVMMSKGMCFPWGYKLIQSPDPIPFLDGVFDERSVRHTPNGFKPIRGAIMAIDKTKLLTENLPSGLSHDEMGDEQSKKKDKAEAEANDTKAKQPQQAKGEADA